MGNIFKYIPNENRGDKVIMRPGEHVIVKREEVDPAIFNAKTAKFYFGGQLEIPEGYQLLTFQTHTLPSQNTIFDQYGSSIAIDVWFINTERVEVQSVWNEIIQKYDYSEPGKVIRTLTEEEGPRLTLKPEKK